MGKTEAAGLTLDRLKKEGYLLFEVVVGSQAYGTQTPESDTDVKGVFIMPDEVEHRLDFQKEWETLILKEGEGADKVETEYFSLKKYMNMLLVGNPTALEMLHSPADCIIYKHDLFNKLIEIRQNFITKKLEKTFAEFALKQMKKAKGQDKKQNWSAERKTRQELIDFCFTFSGQGSKPVKEALESIDAGWDVEFGKQSTFVIPNKGKWTEVERKCGLVKIPHMRDTYAVFYDSTGKLGYKGILSKDRNNLALSSVERNAIPTFQMQFNKDAWSVHCKEYREYQQWEEEKNDDRWVDVQNHGQKIDGKNMLHSVRLVDTAMEIAHLKTVNVRRPNAAHLLDIKKGRLSLQEILDSSQEKLDGLSAAFQVSTLPDDIDDTEFAETIYAEIRAGILANKSPWKF